MSVVMMDANYYLRLMNELDKERAELAQLETRANELQRELLAVHTAIVKKSAKISDLTKQRRLSSICRLPTEILLAIFKLDIRERPGLKRKEELIAVSRQWKDIITNTPTIWSFINITHLHEPDIRKHLKKSKNALLDIVIELSNQTTDLDVLSSCLDLITPHANRWRSFCIVDPSNSKFKTDVGRFFSKLLKDFEFPSLKRVLIPDFDNTPYPTFLSSTRAPALEYLEIRNYSPNDNDFAPVATLRALHLHIKHSHRVVNFSSFIPTHALTTLKLEGDICDWTFQPNGLHFPVLASLDLNVSNVNQVLEAIVAPNLERFVYCDDFAAPRVVFGGVGPKFSSVRYLRMCSTGRMDHIIKRASQFNNNHYDPPRFECQTFPGVRHVELNSEVLLNVCPARPQSENSTQDPYPMDCWKDLESISVEIPSETTTSLVSPSIKWTEACDRLLGWLTQRRNSDAPLLRVKVMHVPDWPAEYDLKYLVCLYDSLKVCCNLKFDVPLELNARFAVDADSLLLVSTTYVSRNNVRFILSSSQHLEFTDDSSQLKGMPSYVWYRKKRGGW